MARQLNKAGEFIERMSKFYNGRKCRLKRKDSEYAVNLALEQVREKAKKMRYTTNPTKTYHAINWHDLDKIINNLKL